MLVKSRFIVVLFLGALQFSDLSPVIDRFRTVEKYSLNIDQSVEDLEPDDHHSLLVTRGQEVISTTLTESGHHREITLTVRTFNETFILDLKLNTYLLASTYIEKAITDSGEVYNDVNHVKGHCYYVGRVRDRPQSTAAVSTCKGIVGYFSVGNMSYHIEPRSANLRGRHKVFRSRDDVHSNHRCGTKDSQLKWSSGGGTQSGSSPNGRMKRSFMWPQGQDRSVKVVEVYVSNDYSQYVARQKSVDNVYTRTKQIINIASLDYHPLGIYLVLVGVEVWTSRDQFTVNASDASQTLDNWYSYRKKSINPYHYNDNAVFLTNFSFPNGVVGKATLGSMCSNALSGSIVSDINVRPAAAAAIFAHEMGHNFGLGHDTDSCACNDQNSRNRCIMHPETSFERPPTKWSSCSTQQLQTKLKQGVDTCLYDVPQTIFQSSSATCGNGIIEQGEACDCGNAPSDVCNPSCCSSTTCQLTSSAACASGKCCDIQRCQKKSSGTVCRLSSSGCDVAETCNGVDSSCPSDSFQQDGRNCTTTLGDFAYCYQGQCRSHRTQCELIWGPGTLPSLEICYAGLNEEGAYYGNCGVNWLPNVTYIRCSTGDVDCGRLHCQGSRKQLYSYQNFFIQATASYGNISCHSVIFDYGLRTQDPGLVPNGAKCGEGMWCQNQQCRRVPDVTVPRPSTTTTVKTLTTTTTTTTTKSPMTTIWTTTTTRTPILTTSKPTSTEKPAPITRKSSTSTTVTTTTIKPTPIITTNRSIRPTPKKKKVPTATLR